MVFPEAELPVIDISVLQSELKEGDPDLQRLCNQVKEAAQQWGAFRVVNHGVEQELLNTVDSVSRGLFSLPPQVKERAVCLPFDGYSKGVGLSSGEAICFPAVLASDSIQQYAQKLWPQGNPEFCDSLRTYSSKLADLTNSLIKLILEGLQLSKHFEIDFVECEALLRLNYFSLCEKSSGANDILLKEHTDLGVMTILYNDQVAGLEMRSKQGEWFTVKPLAGSFTVIIASALKIWSNDRCWSVEHRVAYEGKGPRLSIGFFWNFLKEKEVRVPEELIDEHYPHHYKTFLFKDYRNARVQEAPLDIFI
ncbi:2-oxoglutarate-dependent dioxygenase AOP3 isoform X1 [Cryptomeria japonica]|uniref:2-oxoglutarate-dependent dioxygenase AOP3 isoform X1 n=1 Tax=Cryptomeria japonica TaxID=3369 RepID=UPI0027DA1714|nr:2-oxoglutarate-dependent dioxygenase AOP3 isoform X1 [Cryptomeria japonica]